MITEANTDDERREVLQLFLRTFDDIDPAAVPMTAMDPVYAPLIVQYRDSQFGSLLGAALTCRAQIAATTVTATRMGMPIPPGRDYTTVLDKHSELDLISVLPEARRQGVGTQMITYMEVRLRGRGVRLWFGNATEDMDVDQLRKFYTRHGFNVLDQGQPLPPLLGREWIMPGTSLPAFYFYKQL